jgi:hypothetical protein
MCAIRSLGVLEIKSTKEDKSDVIFVPRCVVRVLWLGVDYRKAGWLKQRGMMLCKTLHQRPVALSRLLKGCTSDVG